MDRFERQRGLVRQDLVAGLRVSIEPSEAMPDAFIQSLTVLAEHLGVMNFPVDASRSEYTIHWSADDEPDASVLTSIYASYGEDGVYLDGSARKKPSHPMYDMALSTICSSLVWSEILRRSGCYLPIEVPKVSVSVNVRVNENALHSNLNKLDIRLEGHNTSTNVRETGDGSSHRRVLLRLDEEDPIAQQLIERLCISAMDEKIEPRYPVVQLNLPPPQLDLSGHITVVGAGGLGTWCLHNLVGGIKSSNHSSIAFLVFDKDLEVEEHNLNRQVLFTKNDVGSSKISATRRWLQSQLEDASVDVAWELTDSLALDEYSPAEGGLDLDSLLEQIPEVSETNIAPLSLEETLPVIQSTDAIIGCLDAMRPRVLSDFLAAKINQPYINGGVKNFVAEYREFATTNLVERYGPKVAQDRKVFSCQEDGEVPMTSIVLTNAYAGAFQAIAALQRLSGRQRSTIESTYWNAHSNEVYVTESTATAVDRSPSISMLKRALWPTSAKKEQDTPESSTAGV